MSKSRLRNSSRNIKAVWILQLVHIVCQFAARTAIIKMLTIEYVGLSGLFSNVLTMLSLAELGVGEAIIFSLYGPIARSEHKTIAAIMRFYKKVYISVGILIAVAGGIIAPFIDFFIKDMPENIPNITLIYLLYVANSAVSYFFSYKSTFVTANQMNYLVAINSGVNELLMVSVQIAALYFTKNYIIYMIIGVIFVLIKNITITIIADKKYPYITDKTAGKIPKDIFSNIIKNTGAMVFHKVGSVIVFATDNLILSKFVGLLEVGLYTNYCLISNAIIAFINNGFNGIAASVGNLVAEEDVDKQEKVFDNLMFINFWLYVFSGCCLFNLMNPFINDIWLGDGYTFKTGIVLAIIVKIYITGMRSSVQSFKNAKGLYWQNKFMPIGESIINLVASILLVHKLGVIGVLLGTIISSLLTCVWIEPRVLYKHGFGKSPKGYYVRYIKYFTLFLLIMMVTYGVNSFIPGAGIMSFVAQCIVSATIPNIIMVLIFFRTSEFQYSYRIVKKFIKR